MSISLGQAALAFAGGAASNYNQQEAEKRQSSIRMEERNRELAEMHQYRVTETRLTNELAQDIDTENTQKAIKALGGFDNPSSHIYVAMKLGIPQEVAVRKVANGWRADMSQFTKPIRARETLNSAQESVQGDGRLTRRFAEFGEQLKPYEDAPVDVEGIPRLESGSSDVSAWMSPAAPETGVKVGDGYYAQRIDPATGELNVRPVIDAPTDRSTFTEVKDMYIDPKGDLVRLTRSGNQFFEPGSDEPVDMSQYTINDPDVIKDELLRMQNERVGIEEQIAEGVDVTRNARDLEDINKRIEKLVSFGRTEADADYLGTNERRVNDLDARLSATNAAMESLVRLGNISTDQLGGAAGVTATVFSNINTQIRGVTDAVGITQGRTTADMLSELKATGLDLSDPNVTSIPFVRGMQNAERVTLFYGIASAMRESGRRDISNADVERATKIINDLSNSKTQQGAMVQLETIFKGRIREVTADIINTPNVDPEMRLRASMQYVRTVASWKEGENYLVDRRNKQIWMNMGDDQPPIPLKDFLFEFNYNRGF